MIQGKLQKNNHDSGFTIIESLVGMLIAATVMVAISPILVLSTATRLQSRRVEIASTIATTFIDAVKVKSIPEPDVVVGGALTSTPRQLLDPDADTYEIGDYLIDTTKMPAPTSRIGLYCFLTEDDTKGTTATTDDVPKGTISKIAVSTDCQHPQVYYIQARRIVQTTGANDGYRLAIRIYRPDVDFTETLTASTATTKNTAATYSGGLGNKQAPLVEMTTDIADSSTTFGALCQRLGLASGESCS